DRGPVPVRRADLGRWQRAQPREQGGPVGLDRHHV
ncbi:MAG: hypothetical protein AVDCRST_MAG66-2815, partial [uncultured Pseudonocardia sp.]